MPASFFWGGLADRGCVLIIIIPPPPSAPPPPPPRRQPCWPWSYLSHQSRD